MNEQFGIGQAVSRFEDPRLLRGEGRYINDFSVAGQAQADAVAADAGEHAVVDEVRVEAVDFLGDDAGELEQHGVDLRLAAQFGCIRLHVRASRSGVSGAELPGGIV